MIALIQTATNAARTTSETQVQKVPNGSLQTYLQRQCEACGAEREKVLNKDIPKHSNHLQFMSPRPRERGTTGKEGHRDT
jgi:hypothetical protein